MNSYVAERFAGERLAELHREAAGGRLLRLARETGTGAPLMAPRSTGAVTRIARGIVRQARRIVDAPASAG